MKIKDIPSAENLFTEMAGLGTFPFIDQNTGPVFLMRYGNLPINESVSGDTAESLAPLIVAFYASRWETVMGIEGMDISGFEVRTVDETRDNVSDVTTLGTDTQKVSAYDDPTLLDDSATERDNSENTTGNMMRTLSEVRGNVKVAFDNLPYASQMNILNVAMADVADFLKTDIF